MLAVSETRLHANLRGIIRSAILYGVIGGGLRLVALTKVIGIERLC